MVERELTFGAATASVDAIQRAAYRMSDRLSIDLIEEGQDFRCTLHLVSDDAADAAVAVGEFRNHVLDEVLRARIREETTEVRNVILSLAFSHTGLVAQD